MIVRMAVAVVVVDNYIVTHHPTSVAAEHLSTTPKLADNPTTTAVGPDSHQRRQMADKSSDSMADNLARRMIRRMDSVDTTVAEVEEGSEDRSLESGADRNLVAIVAELAHKTTSLAA